ncbi:unnamed protein product [Tilletia controversa]|nr:hypothetical protein CF328_g1545 [Tilletia controversa]CAD6904542.1 unnamed protein product [Tilletia controversa]CAD6924299.1 unnamed protein product [Tilletia controversa]
MEGQVMGVQVQQTLLRNIQQAVVPIDTAPPPTAVLIPWLAGAAIGFAGVIVAYFNNSRSSADHDTPRASRWIYAVLLPFVSENEAVELRERRLKERARSSSSQAGQDEHGQDDGTIGFVRQRRRAMGMLLIAFLETASSATQLGLTVGAGNFSAASLEVMLSWIIVTVLVIANPPQTPPYFLLILVQILASVDLLRLLDHLPEMAAGAFLPTFPTFDLFLCFGFVVLGLSTPMSAGGYEAVVSKSERKRLESGLVVEEAEALEQVYEDCPTSPEDYASLWGIVSYRWMNQIQRLALLRPLQATDVWRLRDINDVRLLYAKFRKLPGGLLARVLKTNANDIALDALYKVVGVSLAYAGPAVMKQILDAIAASDEQTWGGSEDSVNDEWTPRQKAFIWAVVGLVLTIVRFMSELQNFHHARQVGLRIRITLVQELFEKALKRRDVSIAPATTSSASPSGASTPSPTFAETDGPLRPEERGVGDASLDPADLTLAAEQEADRETQPLEAGDTADDSDVNGRADVGKLMNLMSNAVNDLVRMGCDLHQLYGAPAEVIIATTFLYFILGWPALAGLTVLVLALPLNYLLGQRNMRLQRLYAEDRDVRLNLMCELIGAVKFLKLQATEQFWKAKVVDARDEELKRLLACKINSFLFELLWSAIPILVTLLSFFLYTSVLQKELTVSVAFTSITLFYMLRAPLGVIPTFLTLGLQALVSVRRLEAFLDEEEVEDTISSLKHTSQPHPAGIPSKSSLRLEDASFSYGSGKFGLSNISIEFRPGLSIVCGSNGAGKSTLLSAILGEVPRTSGTVYLPKFDNLSAGQTSNISFASQTSWLQDGVSVRDNILFASAFEEERYHETIRACALVEDLAAMPSGDATRISAATVSGGQRARISLARALYARSEFVLLEDVLAAVDVHVQRHLVKYALGGPLAKDRTIVLVTHHVASVAFLASWIVLLEHGTVAAQGTADDMKDRIQSVALVRGRLPEVEKGEASEDETQGLIQDESKDEAEAQRQEATLLFEKEARATGRVQLRTAAFYIAACSGFIWAAIVLLTVIFRVISVGEQFWLKLWGEAGQRRHPLHSQDYYLVIYAGIGLSIIALNAVKVALFFWTSFRASRLIFEQTFSALLGTSLRWFERRSAGQIQNRFSTDQNVADVELPQTLMNTINNAFALLSFLLICGYIVPWFLLPCVIGLVLGPYLVRGFLAATRDLQRIEATSMTPLYAVFGEAVRGLMTIRAFGAEPLYIRNLTTTLEVVSAQWWCICSIEVWLSFRFQILGGVAVFLVSTLGLLSAVPSGSAGMLIASSQLLTQAIYFLLNDVKNLNRNLASIERLAEYARLEPEEGRPSSDTAVASRSRAPAAWPSLESTIVIEDLNVRYLKHSPLVLQDINLMINPREKIAIVGKTGSGKSTLISCLLGAGVPESGRVLIDGLDISRVSLHDLRSRCTFVPQDPVILSGTIRSNLDPAGEHTDEELLHILRQIQPSQAFAPSSSSSSDDNNAEGIRKPTTTHAMNIDSAVASGGTNFSAGEAQIISLARALLRAAPIVILDEATSSASAEADALIQRVVRQNKTSTFITVAHRLSTVMDYDRIVVMHAGRIVEIGSPSELAAKKGGIFAGMVKQ